MVMGEGMVVDLVEKKQNRKPADKLQITFRVLWVNSTRTETLGEPSVFCSFPPWFTETGVSLQMGQGNTYLKAGTFFFLLYVGS